MREIKFKIWEPNRNRFLPENESSENLLDVFQGKPVSNIYSVHEYGDEMEYYNDGSYVLCQYTGFKDNEKNEIYDGDILFGREEGDGETTAWTDIYYSVFFNEEWGRWSIKMASQEKHFDDLCDIVDEYVVAGNIYENPDLLKDGS